MRVLVAGYGEVRIFSERIFGYKRYIVEWPDHTEIFSSLWYKEKTVKELVEEKLNRGSELG